ncbi:hypothetical protein BDZ45DRAFT_744260 [Acephala macrosclerotiorum]|nr:hypothetical protein BDZ45DRAFT_744260 [Acephala macrosclerotiorum]
MALFIDAGVRLEMKMPQLRNNIQSIGYDMTRIDDNFDEILNPLHQDDTVDEQRVQVGRL